MNNVIEKLSGGSGIYSHKQGVNDGGEKAGMAGEIANTCVLFFLPGVMLNVREGDFFECPPPLADLQAHGWEPTAPQEEDRRRDAIGP